MSSQQNTEVKRLLQEGEQLRSDFKRAQDKIAELEREKSNMFNPRSSGVSRELHVLSSFGCKHIGQLFEKNIAHPRFNFVEPSIKMGALELKKDLEYARWIAQMFYNAPRDSKNFDDGARASAVACILDTGFAKEVDLRGRLKAFGTDVTGAGAEWIMTAVSSNFVEEYELERKVQALFREQPMSTNPFKLPVKKDGTKARIATEGGSHADSNFGTTDIEFDAIRLKELYWFPDELTEDSAPNLMEVGRSELMEAQMRAVEAAIINGDNSATHMDSDIHAGSATLCEKAWKGLRKLALANSANGSTHDFSNGAISTVLLDTLRIKGKKWMLSPREGVLIVGSTSYGQMLSLDEVSTVDQFGPMATMLTGVLSVFRGIPIVVSESVREDVNASGVYDGTTTDRSFVIFANKRRFYVGRRAPIRMRVGMDPRAEYERFQLTSNQRVDFKGHDQSATELSTVIGYNVGT